MDRMFPFGFPSATAFYLVLYVATFALHQAFMHYVAAGSIYVAWATMFAGGGDSPRAAQPLATTLRDWMPFMLSAAITAGVAPLLFVQVLYPRHFYTANLLLSWRWMVVIPVLITAFYLLYLVKSSTVVRWPVLGRMAVVLTVAVSFLFVGFCWTANHLISIHEESWADIYASGRVLISSQAVMLRTLVWTGGACAGMAAVAGWQLAGKRQSIDNALMITETRRLAWFSLGGLTIAAVAAVVYFIRSGTPVRGLILGSFALPYTIAAVLGLVLQAVSWCVLLRTGMHRGWLAGASCGCALLLVAAAVLRETLRLATVDVSALYPRHAAAGAIGGLSVFLTCAIFNTALIALCVWLVRRRLSQAAG